MLVFSQSCNVWFIDQSLDYRRTESNMVTERTETVANLRQVIESPTSPKVGESL